MRVSRQTVRQWAARGLLPCVRVGAFGRLRFDPDAIKRAPADRGRAA